MAIVRNVFILMHMAFMIAFCIASFFILVDKYKLDNEPNKEQQPIIYSANISNVPLQPPNIIITEKANWHRIIAQRSKQPFKCNTSTHNNILKISPETNNWFPYYLRCKYVLPDLSDNASIAGELFHSKQLNYIHNYKAAGTTIQSALNRLFVEKKLNVNAADPLNLKTHRQQILSGPIQRGGMRRDTFLKSINKNATIFTFVRDPMQKFLSGFFEAVKRKIEKKQKRMEMDIDFDGMTGLQILRIWINNMLQPTTVKKNRLMLEEIPERKWINFHLVSNHHFMQTVHSLFTFVGNLDNLNNDLPQVLAKHIVDPQLKSNASLLMETYFKHERNRNDGYVRNVGNNILHKFNLKREDLNDEDIANICEIYWDDYICFPFEIPAACNITELFEKHYHRHVEYSSCY